MNLYLSHESALQLYRARKPSRVIAGERCPLQSEHVPSLKKEEALWLQSEFSVSLPIFCEVPGAISRRNSRVLTCLVQPPALAQPGYIHLGKSLYVASPELVMAQIAGALTDGRIAPCCKWKSVTTAKRFPVIALAVLGSELAANYVLNEDSDDGFDECAPVLDLRNLDALLEATSSFHGKKALKQARQFMVEHANSPAEIQLALLASMPTAAGGAGLPKPVLNKAISVAYGKNTLTRIPDLLFEESGVVMEYNGGRHEGERADEDDERRNELIDRGLEVLVVNKKQLQNAELLESVLGTAARKTGSSGRRAADYVQRREDLRGIAFGLLGTNCKESLADRLPFTR